VKAPIDSDRMRKAREIADNPSDYQVCEGCDSIVGSGATTCPNCHAYRFDARPERVSDQALLLGRREQQSVTAEDMS